MNEFLNELGIDLIGDYDEDGKYVIEIEDSNTYSKVFS